MQINEIPESVEFDAINYAFNSTDTRCGATHACEVCPKARHCDVFSRYQAYIAGYKARAEQFDKFADNLLLSQMFSMNYLI